MERFISVPLSLFGKGSIALLPGELRKKRYRRALIVTDRFLYDSGVADKVGARLLEADIEYAIYYDVLPNPTVSVVNECINAALTLQVDLLVAVGGGSPIDTCKAVSIVAANGGRVEDYEGEGKSSEKGIPIAAINTTAGTGSEVTSFYIVTDQKRHSKMCMIDPNCMVSIAVNDPDFMMSMPKGLTAATGMDALTHGVEAALTWKATALTDKDALWAIKTIKDYLPEAVEHGENTRAREMMAYGEYTAGMAFSNGGLGMVHAMAHSLGGFYNLPHGICNAVLLPYVMEYNGRYEKTHEKYRQIAKALGIPGAKELTGRQAAVQCVECIRNLSKRVGIPEHLAELKVDPGDFEALSRLALKDACMEANPVQPELRQVMEVYKKAYERL